MTNKNYLHYLLLLFSGSFLITNTALSQEWFTPHSQLTNGVFSPENSRPNPNSFVQMIGTTGGAKLKPSDSNYLGKDIFKNIRSFHLMEIDFRHQLVPNQVQTQLKPHTCGCDFSIPSCSDTISCDVPEIGEIGDSPFYEWKSRYCAWKQPNGNYKVDEVYASIEAIYTPSPVPVAGVPEDITCGFVQGKGYPNKWYSSEEWGGSPAAIRANARKYADSFIASFCPDDESQPCLIDVLEIGSEPWGEDPGLLAYHEICWGIIEAMQSAYQSIDKSGWRMKLSTAAFSAHSPNSSCGSDRNQFIGDMIPDQRDIYGNSMRDYFDFISIHNYAFNSNTLCFDPKVQEMPESPDGNFLRLKNMQTWAATNMPNAKVNLTEFGWNSGTPEGYCNYFIGEANQAAYYMRSYLLAARFGIHKAFTYATYDSYVEFIYCSTSPIKGKAVFDKNDNIISDTRQPKLVLTALDQSLRQIKDKHFIKVLEESLVENGTIAYLIGDYDVASKTSTPTHIVAWKAQSLEGSTDQNRIFSEDYPSPSASPINISLPTADMKMNLNDKYFYLGWKSASENEGFISNNLNNIVAINGPNNNEVAVRLSALPIVIPIEANGCTYNENGTLNSCVENNASGSCEDLTFTGTSEAIQVTGLNGNYAKVEIIGANTDWQIQLVCDGNCAVNETISNLSAGVYTVKVNFVNQDGIYCFREETVAISSSDNGGNNGNNEGTAVNCNNVIFNSSQGQITLQNLSGTYQKVEIIGANTDWKIIPICDGDCNSSQTIPNLQTGTYIVKVFMSDSDGNSCYREEDVIVSQQTGGNENGVDCNRLNFTATNNQITINDGIGRPTKVDLIGANTGWSIENICDNNCSFPITIPNLSTGEYTVKIYLADDNGMNCYREANVNVGNSSSRNSTFIERGISLFPNPAKNKIHVQTTLLNQQNSTILIYNTFGKVIKSFSNQVMTDSVFSINLADFENGIYFLAIKAEGQSLKTSRFIVENLK